MILVLRPGPFKGVLPPAGASMLGTSPWPLQDQKPFRRSLRELMRVTFVATKVTKIAHAAKAPGKLRRVPCDARSGRDSPNSLPSVAQTCGASFSARPCASRRHRGRWVAAERLVLVVTDLRA